jgi:hypothetical protein
LNRKSITVVDYRFASKLRDMNAFIEETVKNNLTVALFTTDKSNEQQFPISTEVIGLSLFQMPAIYHHIKEGEELSLYYNYGASQPQQAVEIYFRNFKLGYLPHTTASLIEKVLMHGFDLKVKVSQIVKRKYLPINSLFIQINENYL